MAKHRLEDLAFVDSSINDDYVPTAGELFAMVQLGDGAELGDTQPMAAVEMFDDEPVDPPATSEVRVGRHRKPETTTSELIIELIKRGDSYYLHQPGDDDELQTEAELETDQPEATVEPVEEYVGRHRKQEKEPTTRWQRLAAKAGALVTVAAATLSSIGGNAAVEQEPIVPAAAASPVSPTSPADLTKNLVFMPTVESMEKDTVFGQVLTRINEAIPQKPLELTQEQKMDLSKQGLAKIVPQPYLDAIWAGGTSMRVAPELLLAIFTEENFTAIDPQNIPQRWQSFLRQHPDANSGWPTNQFHTQGAFQFIPPTWAAYGLGGNPQHIADEARGAANYLHANGADIDLHTSKWHNAIFNYNHAEWYVQKVYDYFYYYWQQSHAWEAQAQQPVKPPTQHEVRSQLLDAMATLSAKS